MIDRQADRATIRLLAKVDKLRKELKQLEPELAKASHAYGKRRGYDWFNEWNLRNTINLERQAA
jgi:hypothetical protein